MSTQQKNRILIAGFFLVLLIAYQFSFKKTFELKSNIHKLTKEKKLLTNVEEKIEYHQLENQYLDSILKSNDVSANQSFEQNLFQKITKLSEEHKLKIISYGKPHEFRKDDSKLLSYTIEVKGDFRNLLLFSNTLEQQRLGKFSQFSLEKKRNYRTRKNELIGKIVLQRLSK